MNQELYESAKWLIGAIAHGLHARKEAEGAAEMLGRLAEQRLDEVAFQEPEPKGLPVLCHFAEATAETMLLDPDLAAAIAAIADHLKWLQSPSYSDAILGEGFTANYGWCEIVGPQGFFRGDDFLLGLLMLGPHLHYLDHYHPAPELYWPLTGGSWWRKGKGEFTEKKAGAIIWHAPQVVHATKTGTEPMLAVWCWTRDTVTDARLVAA